MDRFGGLIWEAERLAQLALDEDWASLLAKDGDVDDGAAVDGRTVLTHADLRRMVTAIQMLATLGVTPVEDPTSKVVYDARTVVFHAAVNPLLWVNDDFFTTDEVTAGDPDGVVRVAPLPEVVTEKETAQDKIDDIGAIAVPIP
jgi:hypothetical protein